MYKYYTDLTGVDSCKRDYIKNVASYHEIEIQNCYIKDLYYSNTQTIQNCIVSKVLIGPWSSYTSKRDLGVVRGNRFYFLGVLSSTYNAGDFLEVCLPEISKYNEVVNLYTTVNTEQYIPLFKETVKHISSSSNIQTLFYWREYPKLKTVNGEPICR